jgi:cytochrome P450
MREFARKSTGRTQVDQLELLHAGKTVTPAPIQHVPVSRLDPYAEDVLTDPYDHYAELRRLGAVVWLDRYAVYALPCYREVKDVLGDHATFCSSAGAGLSNFHREKPWRHPSILLEVDPPEHDRTRQQMVRVLNPASVRALRPQFEQVAEEMVRRFAECDECEGVAELAAAYPTKVFGDAVGLRPDGREALLPYGDMVFNGFGPVNDRFRKSLAEAAHVPAWIEDACKRQSLAPGGFGSRLYEGVDRGEITEEEAALLVRSLLSAGLDTTVFTLSNALVNFARHPEQWTKLKNDPSLARNAVEEVLRYDGTFHTFYRTTTRPVEIAGVRMETSQKLLVMTASANRDAAMWERPDEFDIGRRTTGQMGFGFGIHACVGQMLARLELEIILNAMARMVDSFELTAEPTLHFNNTVRGYKRIPLRVKAR